MDRGGAESNLKEPVIIEISGDSPAKGMYAMSRRDNVIEDNVLIQGVSDTQPNNEDSSATKKEREKEGTEGTPQDVLPSPELRYRSYFEVPNDNQLVDGLLLRPAEEIRPPISLKPTKYLEWTIPTPPRVKMAHYDIVLGISTENLKLEAVEAIIITIHHKVHGHSFVKSEVVTSQELRSLCLIETQDGVDDATISADQGSKSSDNVTATPKGLYRWKLHEKLADLEEEHPVQLAMEIKTWQGESPDYGSIELHFAEILTEAQACYNDGSSVDPSYREHKPFIHTVDLNRTGKSELDEAQDGPVRVTDYIISGDGTHILVAAVGGEHLFLQLWHFIEKEHLGAEPFRSPRNEPIQPKLVAWMQLPKIDRSLYELCLSWNAELFAYIDLARLHAQASTETTETMENMKENITNNTMFCKVENRCYEVPAGAIAGTGFRRFDVGKQCPKLKDLSAKAAFLIKSDGFFDTFVTCDGITIEVYNVFFMQWCHLRTITMDQSSSVQGIAASVSSALRNNHRGSYLVMREPGAHHVSTWNIQRGIRQSSYANLTYEQLNNVNDQAAMSKDGKRIVVPDNHQLDIYWTETWTLIANYTFRDMEHNPPTRPLQFIRNDMQIMVSLDTQQPLFHRRNRGLILDANTGSFVEEYIAEGYDTFWTAFESPTKTQAICIGVSQLSLFNVEDRIVSSFKRLKKRCSPSCRLTASLEDHGLTEATVPSSLYFEAVFSITPIVAHGHRENLPVIIVTALEKNSQQLEMMLIPVPKSLVFRSAPFVNKFSQLIVAFDKLLMIWNVPADLQDKFTLQLVLAVDNPTDWGICPHQQVYELHTPPQDVSGGTDLDNPMPDMDNNFMLGVARLPLLLDNASVFVQQEIIHYIGNYINYFSSGTLYKSDIVGYVCGKWEASTHGPTVKLWRALLAHTSWRWVPRSDMLTEDNPISLLLAQTDKHPEAFELAEVFIDYCLRQAKLEKDPHFLLPIRQCLHELMNPSKPYYEITRMLSRELAYLEVRDRDDLMNHHWIAHPLEPRLRFWKPSAGGLNQNNDQVLHFTASPTDNPPENSFSRNIYLATFDMLWIETVPFLSMWEEIMILAFQFHRIVPGTYESFPKDVQDVIDFIRDPTEDMASKWMHFLEFALRVPFRVLFPFLYLLVILLATLLLHITRTFGLTLFSMVVCHPFELEALDHPAIAALVEYKWNTIGFQYWAVRFFLQCAYYVLVLTSVFMQIYRYDNKSAMKYIYITIIVASYFFISSEVQQMFRDRWRYFQSFYNYVDLFAFVTPCVACILQLVWSDPGVQNTLFSFSVLFIFLHFLFELRVFRSVCKFVSIIIYAIASIKVFFFVFVGGIVAFAIAIMHVLHNCTDAAICPSYTESFSFNILRAISMTYFMISGRYDPVSNGFNNNDIAFHVLLMIFFFFTVIIMLNVLIALINHAFDDGDRIWKLEWLRNRMRYVESAENLTFHIENFRESRDYFPETIYYTATPIQVREYRRKTQNIKEESTPTVELTTDAGAQSQQEQKEESSTNAGDSRNLMAMLKQFQDEQKMAREEQQQALAKQIQVMEQLQVAHEEQKQVAEELHKELVLLKKQWKQ